MPEQLSARSSFKRCKVSAPPMHKLRVRLEIINYWDKLGFDAKQLEFLARLCKNDVGKVLNMMQMGNFDALLGLRGKLTVKSLARLELEYEGKLKIESTGVHNRHQLFQFIQTNSQEIDRDLEGFADFQDLLAVTDLSFTQVRFKQYDRKAFARPQNNKMSCLSGLTSQLEFLQTYWEKSIKPEGTVSLMEQTAPIPLNSYLRKAFAYMGSPTDYISLMEGLSNCNPRQMSLRSGKSIGEMEGVQKKYNKLLNTVSY